MPSWQVRVPKPAHILFLIDTFFGGTGGAEGALVRIVAGLPKDRFRCSVITFRSDPAGKHGSELACPFYIYELTSTYNWNALKVAMRLRRFIREEQVDIVHTLFETADLWGAPVARLAGCRRIISSRRDMGILRRGKHHLFYRWLAPIYSQVQTVSNEVGTFAVKEDGLDPARVVTVYNGIDATHFQPGSVPATPRETIGAADASQVILSVGNIRRVKGYETLLAAAEIVVREFPRARFVIAGNPHEPDFQAELEAQRRQLGLEQSVILLGVRNDVPSLLATADIFCLPSRSEGLSNALLEAMASSLPAVATSVGGNRETIRDGETGFLVPPGSAPDMAGRLLALLRDPGKAREMGAAGRRLVEEKFTVESMLKQLVRNYDALLAK